MYTVMALELQDLEITTILKGIRLNTHVNILFDGK